MWGNQFLEYYFSPAQIGTWEQTITINDNSVGSAALKEATAGSGDLHLNWRAAIQTRIESHAGAPLDFSKCA